MQGYNLKYLTQRAMTNGVLFMASHHVLCPTFVFFHIVHSYIYICIEINKTALPEVPRQRSYHLSFRICCCCCTKRRKIREFHDQEIKVVFR